jgi:hypothetical protein
MGSDHIHIHLIRLHDGGDGDGDGDGAARHGLIKIKIILSFDLVDLLATFCFLTPDLILSQARGLLREAFRNFIGESRMEEQEQKPVIMKKKSKKRIVYETESSSPEDEVVHEAVSLAVSCCEE